MPILLIAYYFAPATKLDNARFVTEMSSFNNIAYLTRGRNSTRCICWSEW